MPKRFSKRKLQVVNTETNRPIHPQPTSSKTYNPYAVLVPFTSVSSRANSQHLPKERKTSNNFGGHLEFKNLRMEQEGILQAHASMWASEHKGNVLPWIVYIIGHYLWPNFSLRVKRILGFIRGIRS